MGSLYETLSSRGVVGVRTRIAGASSPVRVGDGLSAQPHKLIRTGGRVQSKDPTLRELLLEELLLNRRIH